MEAIRMTSSAHACRNALLVEGDFLTLSSLRETLAAAGFDMIRATGAAQTAQERSSW